MAKQSFTVGQVLTAAQLTSLQQTAMLGGAASAKTASYTLVAADAGTTISMTSTSATTVTVNTGLFAAGDTVFIQNLGSGNLTITAGTATVATAGSLILPQNDAGILYFVSTSSSVFYDFIQVGAVSPLTTKGDLYGFSTLDARIPIGANNTVLTADSAQSLGLKWATPAAGGKLLQVVAGTTTTQTTIASNSFTNTGLTATITPTLNTSKILVILNQNVAISQSANASGLQIGALLKLFRDATAIWGSTGGSQHLYFQLGSNNAANQIIANGAIVYLDAPATTSATTYKTQIAVEGSTTYNTVYCQPGSAASSIILMEIGA